MQQIKEKLQQFRQELYDLFNKRPDAIFNLLDAHSCDSHQYKSVVELSQSPCFEREYSSITDAITHGLSDADFKQIQTLVFNHTRATVNQPPIIFYRLHQQSKTLCKSDARKRDSPFPESCAW